MLRPEATTAAHLGFALKHEGVHLETLSRLTGRSLDVPDTTRCNYVAAVDSERELCASVAVNNARWRVRDNLLATGGFSPQVHLTADTQRALQFSVRERIESLELQFGAELVMRSAVWLTVKESRSSFAIEHEENKLDRIQRFAAMMGQRTGQSADVLGSTELESLQREILGPNALHYGLRRSPVFVGKCAGRLNIWHGMGRRESG